MPTVSASFVEDARWRPLNRAVSVPHRSVRVADTAKLPLALVVFAILFNAILAVVNAHVMPISSSAVIGVEVMIVLSAHALVVQHFRTQMVPWYAMIVVLILFALLRSIATGSFDPKFVRDGLLIPTFVLLGMTVSTKRLPALVVGVQAIVLGVLLFEAVFTDAFSSFFDIRGYYVATRGIDESAFYSAGSDLFVNATRPGERFFSFVDLHRMSSVLLEPVSLGNYVVIITAFVCAFSRRLTWKAMTFLVASNIILLIGCDGRLAAVLSAIIVFVALLAPHLPRKSAFLWLPLVVFGAICLVIALNPPLEDNFQGRIAITVDLLSRYGFTEWLGASDRMLKEAMDSGIAYTVSTQSIFGLLAFWTFLVFSAKERTPEQIKYLHGLCVYLAFTMLVSYSLFSIKTGALLWFIYGSLQASGALSRSAGPGGASTRSPLRPGNAWS